MKWRIIVFVCLFLSCSACFGPQDILDQATPHLSDPKSDPPKQLTCETLSFATTQANPLDRLPVNITGKGNATFMVARLMQTNALAYFERNDSGWSMIVPYSPKLMAPQTVMLEVHLFNAENHVVCNQVELEINGLDAAPGTTSKAVALLEDIIDLEAKLMGQTAQTLMTRAWSDLPVHLHGPSAALYLINGPDNSASIRERISTPNETLPKQSLDVLDAILHNMDYVSELKARKQHLASALSQYGPQTELVDFMATPSVQGATLCGRIKVIKLTNPTELSAAMKESDDSLTVTKNKLWGRAGDVVDYVGAVPSAKVKAVATALGLFLYAHKHLNAGFSRTLPSQLINPSIQSWTAEFLEDEDANGRWDAYNVSAVSKGWNPQEFIVEGLFNAANIALGSIQLQKWLETRNVGVLAKDFDKLNEKRYALSFIESQRKLKGWMNSDIKHNNPRTFCHIPPRKFGPFDLSDQKYSDHTYSQTVKAKGQPKYYTTQATGHGSIIVHAKGSMFPPTSNELASLVSKPVHVPPISIFIEPGLGYIRPGKSIRLTATVHDALDTAISWSVVKGQGVTVEAVSEFGAVLRVPASFEGKDIVVRAVSLSSGGLRATSTIPRQAFASFESGQRMLLEPTSICLAPGQSKQFNATYIGPGDQGIDWDVNPHVSGSNGLFKSTKEGRYTLRATSKNNPDVFEEADVRVEKNGCHCQWAAFLSGPGAIAFGGIKGIQAHVQDNRMNILMKDQFDNAVSIVMTGEHLQDLKAHRAGQYAVLGSVTLSGAKSVVDSSVTLTPPKLVITAWEGNHITGFYEAEVIVFADAVTPFQERIYGRLKVDFSTYIMDASKPLDLFGPNCEY